MRHEPLRRVLTVLLLVVPASLAAQGFRADAERTLAVDSNFSRNFDAHVAYDASGRSVAVWTRSSVLDGLFEIVAQRFDGDGNPAGPLFKVNQRQETYEQNAVLAMAPTGDFAIAWIGWGASGARVFLRTYRPDGAPLANETDVDPADTSASLPRIGIDGKGRSVVAWYSAAGVTVQRFRRNGSPLGSRLQIPRASNPSIAMRPDGGFWLAWRTYTAADHVILYGRAYNAAAQAAGPAIRLNTRRIESQGAPVLAADRSGGLAAAWSSCDFGHLDRGCQIFLRRFSASGQAAGAETQISPPNDLAHDHPALAFSADALAVTWQHCAMEAAGPLSGCRLRLRFFAADGAPLNPAASVSTSELQFDAAVTPSKEGFDLTYAAGQCASKPCDSYFSQGIFSVSFTRP